MPATDETLRRLRSFLDSGRYWPGARLPPERELAGILKVSRTTLRGALAQLQAEGKIWRHVGQGTFFGRPEAVNSGTITLPDELLNPAEVMEVRFILEPAIAGTAALRATAADLQRIEEFVAQVRVAKGIEEYEIADRGLHNVIASATRNPLLIILFRAIDASRSKDVWGQLNRGTLTPQRHRRFVQQHLALLDAMRSRNPEGAEKIMRKHLEAVRDDLFGRWA